MKKIAIVAGLSLFTLLSACGTDSNDDNRENSGNPAGQSIENNSDADADDGGTGQSGVGGGGTSQGSMDGGMANDTSAMKPQP